MSLQTNRGNVRTNLKIDNNYNLTKLLWQQPIYYKNLKFLRS